MSSYLRHLALWTLIVIANAAYSFVIGLENNFSAVAMVTATLIFILVFSILSYKNVWKHWPSHLKKGFRIGLTLKTIFSLGGIIFILVSDFIPTIPPHLKWIELLTVPFALDFLIGILSLEAAEFFLPGASFPKMATLSPTLLVTIISGLFQALYLTALTLVFTLLSWSWSKCKK